jgi:acyl-CoA thioesterase I
MRFMLQIMILLCISLLSLNSYAADEWDTKRYRKGVVPFKVIFFGDSVLSGYGLPDVSNSAPSVLIANFEDETYIDRPVMFKDFSHEGETTSNAVTRIKQLIAMKPDIIILSIGTNDARRGVDPDVVYNNLNIILKDLSRAGIYTLFTGMQSNTSHGYNYLSKFNSVYAKLSQQYSVVFMPYLLEGIGGNRMLLQQDMIHPNIEGAKILSRNIMEYLEKMLQNIRRYRTTLEDNERWRAFMLRENAGRIKRGVPPIYSQEQIDAVTNKP